MRTQSPSNWLHDGQLWEHLTPDSKRTLTTAANLRGALEELPTADWSPVVTLGFKAFEIELLVRVLRPFRTFVRVSVRDAELEQLLEALNESEWSRPLGRFLSGGRPPALAEAMLILGSLHRVAADSPVNGLASLKRWFHGRLPQAHRFWGPKRIADKLYRATVVFRNRYIHDHVVSRSEAQSAIEILWGGSFHRGVLNQGLIALTRGLPKPVLTPEPCPTCGEARWWYPRRDPERFCERCPALRVIESQKRENL